MLQWYFELDHWVISRVISWYSLSSLDPLLTTLKCNIDVIVNSDLLVLNGLESYHDIEYSFRSSLRKPRFTKCLQLQVLVIKYSQLYWVSIRKQKKIEIVYNIKKFCSCILILHTLDSVRIKNKDEIFFVSVISVSTVFQASHSYRSPLGHFVAFILGKNTDFVQHKG